MRGMTMVVAVLAVGAAPVAAQDLCSESKAFRTPATGTWAQYAVAGGSRDLTVRVAMLGTESQGGKAYSRIEMGLDGGERPMVMQVLTGAYPPDLQGGDVAEIVMKAGERPAMKVSGQMLKMAAQMGRGLTDGLSTDWVYDGCADAKLVGTETVTVPAGTFKAKHYRIEKDKADAWVTADVPFGVVKSATVDDQKRTVTVTLTGKGTGAKSAITETPMDMGAMGGMMR